MKLNFINKQLKVDDYLKLSAFCLVFPAYIDFFVSKSPFVQGISYFAYILPVAILLLNYKINISKSFIIFWFIFLSLWIIPSIINLYSGRLESDRIFLHALIAKLFFLTIIVIFARSLFTFFSHNEYKKLFISILIFYIPLIFMIFISCIKELNIFLGCSECRIHPYGNLPFFVSELLLLGIALSFYIDKFWPKLCLIIFCTISLIILQGRAAIIASFFGLFVLLYFPYLKKNLYKFTPWFLLSLLLFISLVIFNFLIDNTSLGSRGFSTLSGRLFMYELSINSIKDNPFFGIGFQVTPNYYNFINHNHNEIHNFFLRIATENGLIVLFFVLSFILVSFLKMIKNNDFVELSFLISFIIYNSLSTRHLSLNLFNILLYIILTRSFYSKHQIKS